MLPNVQPPPTAETIKPATDTRHHFETIMLADGGRLRHWPHFFSERSAAVLLSTLRDEVPWEQIRFRGRPEPRLTAWMGAFTYRYSGVERCPAPTSDLVRILVTEVEEVAFEGTGVHFDGVLLNYYRSGQDRIGLHADAEPDLYPDAPIASLSFGVTRRFVLRHNRTREKVVLPLASGSLLVMDGTTQRFWKHEVPPEPRVTQGRINLTMRCHTSVVER